MSLQYDWSDSVTTTTSFEASNNQRRGVGQDLEPERPHQFGQVRHVGEHSLRALMRRANSTRSYFTTLAANQVALTDTIEAFGTTTKIVDIT